MISSAHRVGEDLTHKPLLIVIDALDEDRDSRALPFLHMFARCFDAVPSLKLLVTSRSTPIKCGAFSYNEFEALGMVLDLDSELRPI
jgi:hypothetical protein